MPIKCYWRVFNCGSLSPCFFHGWWLTIFPTVFLLEDTKSKETQLSLCVCVCVHVCARKAVLEMKHFWMLHVLRHIKTFFFKLAWPRGVNGQKEGEGKKKRKKKKKVFCGSVKNVLMERKVSWLNFFAPYVGLMRDFKSVHENWH